MTTFKMYVKTVIYNEEGKILLLNKKREDNKPDWDLPGSSFTEEESFDETIINNVQKEIGYYVYPGKIIGISDYTEKDTKEVHVIMEGTILNGDLLLSKDYETHTWVLLDRITDYPLTPWLKEYIQKNKTPFEDVKTEIEEITNTKQRRREIIQEDIMTNLNGANSEKINEGVKSSFSLLKDTIIRTFHPQEAKVTKTTPKSKQYPEENYTNEEKYETEEKDSFLDKINFNFKRNEKEKYVDENLLKSSADDIIIEHEDNNHNENTVEDIIINHENTLEDITIKENSTPKKKVFDMNINRQQNMKNSVNKIKKVIKESTQEPKIKIIKSNEQTPHIRTEKESTGKISFNSENIKRNGWKERLNRINRTEANNKKKEAPRPKGQRK